MVKLNIENRVSTVSLKKKRNNARDDKNVIGMKNLRCL
jgi:hypothetical protein